jgi:hypothetical protein
MEAERTPQMMEVLGIDATLLPIIWDADFLYGPRTPSGEDSYVLCEINVSSVFAIPDQAPAAIAHLAQGRGRMVALPEGVAGPGSSICSCSRDIVFRALGCCAA